MADLLVRGIDAALVEALKARAARHKRSVEDEHRSFLAAALAGPRRRTLAEAIACIPNVGRDQDFERTAEDDGTSLRAD